MSSAALLNQIPFGTIGGESISLARALRLLKLDLSDQPRSNAKWTTLIVEKVVLEQAAAELGLCPSDAELQAHIEAFRRERRLHSAAETERFLAERACSLDDFAEALELAWKEQALRQRYAVGPAEGCFGARAAEYDTVVLSELVVQEETLAQELALQLREESADFAHLAREFSIADSRAHAGFLGDLRRADLLGRDSAAVFAANSDRVVGPLPHGTAHRLLRVHEIRRAVFTPEVAEDLARQLWRDWVAARTRAAEPDLTFLWEL